LIILELIFSLFLEFLGEALFELLLEPGLAAAKEARGRENWDPVLATVGYFVLGGILGGLSVWALPERLLQAGPFPGLSLVFSPLGAGLTMAWWGKFRRARGHATTNLATWYGGGAFALGMSLIRFTGVH
jgi:hypothetical protein